MNYNDFFRKEAHVFGKYLLHKIPDESSIALYERAMTVLPIHLDEKDKRILDFIHRNSWSIPLIDAGLTAIKPKSHIRKKIFLMFAILESSPEYSGMFLSRNFSVFYAVYILFTLIKSVIKTGIGALLIKGM